MSIKSIKFYGGSSKGATATGGKATVGAKAKAKKPAKVSSKRK